MTIHHVLSLFLVPLTIAMTSCDWVGLAKPLPLPTRRTVSPAQIHGTWTYKVDYGNTTVTIQFLTDGTFVQTFNPPNGRGPQIGKWNLSSPYINFDAVLLDQGDGSWVPEEISWSIHDGPNGSIIIHALSHPDPDSWVECHKQQTLGNSNMTTSNSASATLDPELLKLLVCPLTRSPLRLEGDELVGSVGGLRYPIRDGIPVLLVDEAKMPAGVASLDEFKKKFAEQIPR